MNIDVGGLNTNYTDNRAGTPTVLFLHGWGAEMGLYAPIFERLRQKGCRVAAFDMPGVGGTDEPPRPLTVDDYVAFTLEFCRKMEISECVIMCHSHGGRIALSMLSDENCPVKCGKAVLIDACGVVLPRSFSAKCRLKLYKLAKRLGTSRVFAPLFRDLYEKMRDARASADYKAASPVMRQTMNNVLPADFQGQMHKIRAEVLLIWGERDTATPLLCGQIMEQKIPGAGLAVIKNAGHFSFSDNWPQFSAVLDAFL